MYPYTGERYSCDTPPLDAYRAHLAASMPCGGIVRETGQHPITLKFQGTIYYMSDREYNDWALKCEAELRKETK